MGIMGLRKTLMAVVLFASPFVFGEQTTIASTDNQNNLTIGGAVPANFPFQEQAFRLRLQPGFFKVNGDIFEDILKSTGMVDANNTIKLVIAGKPNFLRFKNLRTRLQMSENQLSATISLDILKARFYTEKIEGCSITLEGPMSFTTTLNMQEDGRVKADVPADDYHADQVTVEKENCGFMGLLFGAETVRNMMKDTLQEQLGKVINKEEFKYIADPHIDELLAKSRIYLNLPSKTPLNTQKAKSQFLMGMGIRGALAGTNDLHEHLQVVYSREKYLQGFGLEWALDSGVKAMTQKIYDPHYTAKLTKGGSDWPEWGLAPFQKTGEPIAFDAGIMLRASFLQSLFKSLYQAGFFNLQLQDSLMDHKKMSLHPGAWSELFKIKLPNGIKLNNANYEDMRLEISVVEAPDVAIRDGKSLDLQIPEIKMKVSAKAKGIAQEFDVLQMRAKFHIVTTPEMDEDAHLRLRFNERPIESFQILSRNGVGPEVTNAQIEARMNEAVVELLKQTKVEIPFLKGHKIIIPYMGIDGDEAHNDQALAVYLKIK